MKIAKTIITAIFLASILCGCGSANSVNGFPTATPTVYSAEEKFCARGLVAIRNVLTNPASMQVNYIYYYDSEGYILLFADITGENPFGGSARKIYAATYSEVDSPLVASRLDGETQLYVFDIEGSGLEFEVNQSNIANKAQEDLVDEKRVNELYNLYLNNHDITLLQ